MFGTLIIVVCLATSPDVCREEQPPIDMGQGLSCAMNGQTIAAEWLADHPLWTLKGWRCRFGDKGKDA
jgi:hypothetical protein